MEETKMERMPTFEEMEQMEAVSAEDPAFENPEAPDDLVLRLRQPILFEGEECREIDMSGLENTSIRDIEAVTKYLTVVLKKNLNPATVEMTLEFARVMAARVTRKPVEFFNLLSGRDAVALKGLVVGFFFGEEQGRTRPPRL